MSALFFTTVEGWKSLKRMSDADVWDLLEAQPGFSERLREAEADLAAGHGVPFKDVRRGGSRMTEPNPLPPTEGPPTEAETDPFDGDEPEDTDDVEPTDEPKEPKP